MAVLGYMLHDTTVCVDDVAPDTDLRLEDDGGDVVWVLTSDDEPCAHCVCDECGEYIYPDHDKAPSEFARS